MRLNRLIVLIFLIITSFVALNAEVAKLDEFIPPAEDEAGQVSITFSIPEGHYQAQDELFFGIRFAEESPFRLGPIDFPAGKEDEDGQIKYRGEVTLTAPVYSAGGSGDAELIAFYQICQDDGVCLFPEEEHIPLNEAASAIPISSPDRLLLFLLLAVAGGLLLNVMPCVLPVLSFKALNLLQQRQEDNRQIKTHALLYSIGVIATITSLGLIIILLKGAGEAVGWGFQFQNPYYVFSLIVVLLVFALSLFDVWVLTVTAGGRVVETASRGGYVGSLASGAVTVLLATPCTAPFLGSALGFAFSQSWWVILLIMIFVGIGLALPFTLMGFFPSLIRRLPKPGPWMERFKEAMGFLLLGTAAWLFGVLVKQLGRSTITPLLFTLLSITILVWIWGRFAQSSRRRFVRVGSLLVLAAIITITVVLLPVPGPEVAAVDEWDASVVPDGWSEFSSAAVENARAADKPVFIQFSADWCLTCKTNDLTVFSRQEVEETFLSLGVVRLYGDYTNRNEEIGRWIEEFGKAGVPVYALFPPGRSTPVLLPELLTPAMLINTLNNYLAW